VRTELAGVGEAVGQHQPALGVGVDDLNGFAGFVSEQTA
jgi:hypothetical protein